MYQFVLAMVLAAYVGFSRLHQWRFVVREPMLALCGGTASGHCQATADRAAADARTRVADVARGAEDHHPRHGYDLATLFGQQMGGRKSYNPKKKRSADAAFELPCRSLGDERNARREADTTWRRNGC